MTNAKRGVKFNFDNKVYHLKFNMLTYADLEEEFGMSLDEYLSQKNKKLTITSAGIILYFLMLSNYEDFEYTKRQFLMRLDIVNMEKYLLIIKDCFELFNTGPDKKKGGPKKETPLVKTIK